MTIQRRLEIALRISQTIKYGKLDPNNLYDLKLHLSEAMEEADKLTIHSNPTKLETLEVGDTFKYNLKDVGIFKVVAKNEENWINTVRTQSGRKSGDFPWTEIYPV